MHYEVHGRREPQAETVLLSSGLGGIGGFWAPQLPDLCERFRVLTYDHRGTGRSPREVPEDCSIAGMADDVIEVLDRAGIERCHVVGHAIGGLIGLDLALRRPERMRRLVVVNGWSRMDGHTGRCFATRLDLLAHSGVEAYVRAQPIFLYPANWLSQNAERMEREEAAALAHFPGIAATMRRIAAAQAFDLDDRLGEIRAPTLVVATLDDVLVPYGRSERLATGLADARLLLLPHGGHACTVVDPAAVNTPMIDFLDG